MAINAKLPRQDYDGPRAGIELRALEVETLDDGTYRIWVPSRQLTMLEHNMLEALFPNTIEQAHRLLTREALLKAIV